MNVNSCFAWTQTGSITRSLWAWHQRQRTVHIDRQKKKILDGYGAQFALALCPCRPHQSASNDVRCWVIYYDLVPNIVPIGSRFPAIVRNLIFQLASLSETAVQSSEWHPYTTSSSTTSRWLKVRLLYSLCRDMAHAIPVFKPGKVPSFPVLYPQNRWMTRVGSNCVARPSRRQEGRRYQADRWVQETAGIPPCNCCWHRALPKKGDETHGSEKGCET